MAESLGAAVLELGVDTRPLNAGMAKARAEVTRQAAATEKSLATQMSAAGTRMQSAGKTITRHVSLPLLAVGGFAVKSAIDFNKAMTLIQTQAGASAKEVDRLRERVLAFSESGKTAFGPTELAQGLYAIESAGIHGARAMQTLRKASNLAMIGQTDLASTTKALAAAQKTGIRGSQNLDDAIGTLNATVGAGQMHMSDLLAAMGTGFLSAAKQMGLGLPEVGAALAELTKQGIPANAAATRLRMTFSLMAAPTTAAQAALKGIGLDATDLAQTMRSQGLVPALEQLRSHLEGLSKIQQTQVLTQAFGGARSGTTVMALVNNLGDLDTTLQSVHGHAGQVNEDLKKARETSAEELSIQWAKLQGVFTQLGTTLIPTVIPLLQDAGHLVETLLGAFSHMPPFVRTLLLGTIVLGPAIRGFGMLATAIGGVGKAVEFLAGTSIAKSLAGMLGGSTAVLQARIWASDLAKAAGGAIPLAFAAVGIGNIVFRAVTGDTKGAVASAGGALAGGLVGGLVGGLPGALVGAGIGSILGGFLSHLDFTVPKLGLGHRLEETRRAVERQKGQLQDAVKGFDFASKQIARAHRRERDATHEVNRAESALAAARKRYPAHSVPVIQAELRVKRAKDADAKATHQLVQAERFHGIAATVLKEKLRKSLTVEKDRVETLRQAVRQAKNNLKTDHDQHASTNQQIQDLKTWRARQHDLRKAQDDVNQTLKTAAEKIGPKAKQSLDALTDHTGKTRNAIDRLSDDIHNRLADRLNNDFGPASRNAQGVIAKLQERMDSARAKARLLTSQGLNPYIERVAKASGSTKEAGRTLQDVAQGPIPRLQHAIDALGGHFTGQTGKMDKQGGGDIKDLTGAVSQGVSTMGSHLNNALKALGVAKVNFSAAPQKKQAGGEVAGLAGIVPGPATGDRHLLSLNGRPLAALEGTEGIYVLNSKAQARAMEAWNERFPRRADGGYVDLWGRGMAHLAAGGEAKKGGGLRFPFTGAFNWSRTDQGVDFWGTSPIVAMGAAQMMGQGQGAAWPQSHGFLYRLLGGAPKGYSPSSPYIFTYEGAIPSVLSGKVNAGQRIGRMLPTSLEMGFATSSGSPLTPYNGAPDGTPMPAGKSMRRLLEDLAAGKFVPGGGMAEQVARVVLNGPAGALRGVGQGILDKLRGAENDYISRHQPTFAGGAAGFIPGTGGSVVREAGKILLAAGLDKVGAAAILGNAWQESSWDPHAGTMAAGGLWGFTAGDKSMAALAAYANRLHRSMWDVATQTNFMLTTVPQGMKDALNAGPLAAATANFMTNWEAPLVSSENFPRRLQGAQRALAMGYQRGGIVDLWGTGLARLADGGDPLAKKKTGPGGLGHLLSQIGSIEKPMTHKATQAALAKFEERYAKIGIPQDVINQILYLVAGYTQADQMATNAATITGDSPTPLPFAGNTQAGWLGAEFGDLANLRNVLLAAQGWIDKELRRARARMRKLQHRLDALKRKLLALEKRAHAAAERRHRFELKANEVKDRLGSKDDTQGNTDYAKLNRDQTALKDAKGKQKTLASHVNDLKKALKDDRGSLADELKKPAGKQDKGRIASLRKAIDHDKAALAAAQNNNKSGLIDALSGAVDQDKERVTRDRHLLADYNRHATAGLTPYAYQLLERPLAAQIAAIGGKAQRYFIGPEPHDDPKTVAAPKPQGLMPALNARIADLVAGNVGGTDGSTVGSLLSDVQGGTGTVAYGPMVPIDPGAYPTDPSSLVNFLASQGIGGNLLTVAETLKELAAPVDQSGSTPTAMSISDLQSFAAAVRYGAFDTLPYSTLPAFHGGGIIGQSIPGADQPILGRVGEGVFTEDQMAAMAAGLQVHLNFANGMEWLRDFVSVEVRSADRDTHERWRAGVVTP